MKEKKSQKKKTITSKSAIKLEKSDESKDEDEEASEDKNEDLAPLTIKFKMFVKKNWIKKKEDNGKKKEEISYAIGATRDDITSLIVLYSKRILKGAKATQ